MDIKILGPGCATCHELAVMAAKAVSELGIDADVEYVVDVMEIMKHVISTPALMVNGKVKHSGRPLPSDAEVKAFIQEEIE